MLEHIRLDGLFRERARINEDRSNSIEVLSVTQDGQERAVVEPVFGVARDVREIDVRRINAAFVDRLLKEDVDGVVEVKRDERARQALEHHRRFTATGAPVDHHSMTDIEIRLPECQFELVDLFCLR